MKDPRLTDAQTMREARLCSAMSLCVASHIFYQIGKNGLFVKERGNYTRSSHGAE